MSTARPNRLLRVSATLMVALAASSPAHGAGSPANAGPFLQDFLTRGGASIRGWPDKSIASDITGVQYNASQQCALQITGKNGHQFAIQMDKVMSIQAFSQPQAPVNHVEIVGGTLPYDSVDIYLGDATALGRVANALNALFKTCDKSKSLGF